MRSIPTRRLPDDLQIRLLAQGGIQIAECTPVEWLTLALETEAIVRRMQPLDPARHYLASKLAAYETAAALAETVALTTNSASA